MTKQEIIELINKNLAGQGTQIDLSGKLPTILNQILDQIPESGGGVVTYDHSTESRGVVSASELAAAITAVQAGKLVIFKYESDDNLYSISTNAAGTGIIFARDEKSINYLDQDGNWNTKAFVMEDTFGTYIDKTGLDGLAGGQSFTDAEFLTATGKSLLNVATEMGMGFRQLLTSGSPITEEGLFVTGYHNGGIQGTTWERTFIAQTRTQKYTLVVTMSFAPYAVTGTLTVESL